MLHGFYYENLRLIATVRVPGKAPKNKFHISIDTYVFG